MRQKFAEDIRTPENIDFVGHQEFFGCRFENGLAASNACVVELGSRVSCNTRRLKLSLTMMVGWPY